MKKIFTLFLLVFCILGIILAKYPQARAALLNKIGTTVQLTTGNWSSPQGVATIIAETLETTSSAQLAKNLYNLMTDDVKRTFSIDDFTTNIVSSGIEVNNFEVINERGDWAEVKMNLKSGEEIKKFKVILKRENGMWKIFGTEEMP